MSALCNAAGMFSPSGDQIWKNSLDWQPVPIHTIPMDDDYLVYQSIPCDMADKMEAELIESEAMTEFLNGYSELLDFVKENMGKEDLLTNNEVKGVIFYLFDSMNIEKRQGLP